VLNKEEKREFKKKRLKKWKDNEGKGGIKKYSPKKLGERGRNSARSEDNQTDKIAERKKRRRRKTE
jgi:hypothetical protein